MNRAVKNITWVDENGVIQTFPTPAVNLDLPIDKRPPVEEDSVYLSRFADKNPIMINGADFPEDVEYNSSWELDRVNNRININMTKAKNIHRDFLRDERKTHFEETDRLYSQARSLGKETASIRVRQKYLRDITALPSIDSALTTSDLKSIGIDSWQAPVIADLPDGIDPEVERSQLFLEKNKNNLDIVEINQRISVIDVRLSEISSSSLPRDLGEKGALTAEKKSLQNKLYVLSSRNSAIDSRLAEL